MEASSWPEPPPTWLPQNPGNQGSGDSTQNLGLILYGHLSGHYNTLTGLARRLDRSRHLGDLDHPGEIRPLFRHQSRPAKDPAGRSDR